LAERLFASTLGHHLLILNSFERPHPYWEAPAQLHCQMMSTALVAFGGSPCLSQK
jgi:hypothetical protein